MERLFAVTAAIELGAGLALLSVPSVVVSLLLGWTLDHPAAVALGRLAGTALVALGIANWCAGRSGPNRATTGVVVAMAFYNLGAVLVLGSAGLAGTSGVFLWPAVVLHAAMNAWCGMCLWRKRP